MTETNLRRELLEEIINRKNMGDKKFHSETSLQHFGEEDTLPPRQKDSYEDPGVLNMSLNNASESEGRRRRTMSQPGPVSGSLLTATAARAARRKPQRNVVYAAGVDGNDSIPKITIPKGDDSGTATPVGDRDQSSPFQLSMYNSNYRNADSKSLSNYRIYTPMTGGGTPRKRSVMNWDAQSIRSMETQAPPPTSAEDNKKQTRKYLTLISSSMYAILIVTLGLIVNLADTFLRLPVAPIYTMLLGSVGLIYQIYLMIDISNYKKKAIKNQKIKAQYEENMQEYFRGKAEELSNSSPDERIPEPYKPPNLPPPVLIPLKHSYCFSQGRHSGSFYLKLGAAGFAMGLLVHSVLLFTMQMGYLFDQEINNDDCVDYVQVIVDCFNPVYCFVQLYFVFKYSNVIILHREGLALFGFMHMIGSSLCFWIAAIVRETILALNLYAQSVYGNDYGDNNTSPYFESSALEIENQYFGDIIPNGIFNISNFYNENCVGVSSINKVFEKFSPYLYPFSVEFNILIVAVYFIIWSNIGHCHNEDSSNSETNNSLDDGYSVCRIPTANEENDFTSNMVIYADCHASNRGLFVGLILLVLITGVLIIGFVFSSVGDDYLYVGYLLNDATKLGLHSIMLLSAIVAFTQTIKLDINEHPISLLDDILLFICLPPFFMETVLSLVATFNITNVLKSIDFFVMVIQVLVQTPLIMDALRRCCNARKLRRSKPGREVIMFLIIANVGMWLFYTFSYKSPDSLDERYEFYGKVLWTILGHVSLPLIMFYRFHSSVCFVDIWGSAYTPGSEH